MMAVGEGFEPRQEGMAANFITLHCDMQVNSSN